MPRPGRTTPIIVLAIALPLFVTGCSPDASADAAPSSGPSSSQDLSLRQIERPTVFEGDGLEVIPASDGYSDLSEQARRAATLAGGRVYVAMDTGVSAFDVETGEFAWTTWFPTEYTVPGGEGFYEGTGPHAPTVLPDGETVIAAHGLILAGEGTAADQRGFEVTAIDADAGSEAWSVVVPTGPTTGPAGNPLGPRVEAPLIIDARDDLLVLTTPDNYGGGQTVAIDPVGHEVAWEAPGTAFGVVDDTVVTLAELDNGPYPQLVGYDLATGKQKWATGGTDPKDAFLGEGKLVDAETGVLLSIDAYGTAERVTFVLDPATGQTEPAPDGISLTDPVAADGVIYDQGVDGSVVAYDAATLEELWRLPVEGRLVPGNPVYFSGYLYGAIERGEQTEGVVLDGRTGADVASGIDGEIVAVNEYGVLVNRRDGVVFLLATS